MAVASMLPKPTGRRFVAPYVDVCVHVGNGRDIVVRLSALATRADVDAACRQAVELVA